MKRFDWVSGAEWVAREAPHAHPATRRAWDFPQALRTRVTCPYLSVRKPLYAHLHAGLCARRRSLRALRNAPVGRERRVSTGWWAVSLLISALFWTIVAELWIRSR